MNESNLTTMLREVVDATGDIAPVDAGAIVARARRRRRRQYGVVALLSAALIVMAVVAWPTSHKRAESVATRPSVAVRSMTAAQLANGHWSVLPPSPLTSSRTGSAVVWTDHELIVWGGSTVDRGNPENFSDGAAYNPTTNTWRTLPTSPLSARILASAVWTGTEMILWGGFDPANAPNGTSDGAAYNPTTNAWRTLPRSPLSARGAAPAVWTGTDVIIIGGSNHGLQGGLIDGARYDPETNRWDTLPAFTATQHGLDDLAPVWAGDRLVMADLWWDSTPTADGSSQVWGIDFTTYDPSTNRWTPIAQSADAPTGIFGLFWTGDRVLAPTAQLWCGNARCPGGVSPGRQLDLATGTWSPIAPGPADDAFGARAWTGGALFEMSSEILQSTIPFAGHSALWDPATNAWTTIEAATVPVSPGGPAAIWTGNELLIWGDLLDASGAPTTSGGLRFGP